MTSAQQRNHNREIAGAILTFGIFTCQRCFSLPWREPDHCPQPAREHFRSMPPQRFAVPSEVPGLAARRIAADILDGVLHKHRTLDEQLDGTGAHPSLKTLSDRDRALMRRLVATILRRLGTLGHLLSRLLDRGVPTDAPRAQSALLIGAAQILWMDVPITPRSTCRFGWCSRTGAPRNMPASSTRCCGAVRARGNCWSRTLTSNR